MEPLSSPISESSITMDFREAPFIHLMEVPLDQLTDDKIREYLKVTQDQIASPATRRASTKRESDKLEGKKVAKKFSVDDL